MTSTEPPSIDDCQFYYAGEYWDELDRRIRGAGAGSRILLSSMPLDASNSRITSTLNLAADAAARGAEVTVTVDAHGFLLDNNRPGPILLHRNLPTRMPKVFRDKLTLLDHIREQPGAKVAILNIPRRRLSLPIAGRSHIKLGIVDDHIHIGSHNFDSPDCANLTIGFRSAAAADWLHQLMQSAADNGNVAESMSGVDQHFAINDNTDIYVDAGVPGQSLIYEKALELIDSARDWLTITCQYFPNGTTAQHLLRARERGVKLQILYAHPRHQGFVGGLGQYLSLTIERVRLPRSMFSGGLGPNDPMLHAKLIACDGGIMIGSHNYVQAGVQLGTAEIALRSTDSRVAERALRILNDNIHRHDR